MNCRIVSILLFILGFGGFMFTRMSNLIPHFPIAILIAPVFILRFIRTQPKTRGILLTLLGFLLSFNISLWGLFQFDNASTMSIVSIIRSSMLAIVWFLPFMIDRIVHEKFSNTVWSILTFPIIVTSVFFVTSLEGPFDDGGGTLSSFSYGSITFLQARSLFGIWTYILIYSLWFSVTNYFWELKFEWNKIRRPAFAFVSTVILIFVYGIVKVSFFSASEKETVKIAAAVLIPEDGKAVRMEQVFNQRVSSPLDRTLERITKLVNEAAENGARIVSFQEFSMTIQDYEIQRVVEHYQTVARDNNVYLSITYAYFRKDEKGENKHLLIDPNGNILLDYAKRYLLGMGKFGENGVFKKGAEVIQTAETSYGIIGISICRDMGFPSYLRQAAKKDVDIMLSPSYDWPKSPGPWYLMSTIENGFSIVRPTYNGYSYAADYNGEVIAHMDSDLTNNGLMYAEVPVRGIKTLYPIVGDILGWLSLIAMIGMLIYRPRKY